MAKWKPWQKIAFLVYLLLLNLIVFGTLTFVMVQNWRHRAATAAAIAAASPNAFIILPTSTPLPPQTLTPIPPINIPPMPLPGQTGSTLATTSPSITLVEGGRSQPWTPTPSPTRTVTAQAVAQVQIKTPTASNTPKPAPSPTSTYIPTPLPTSTSTRPPTATPTPLPTATSTPTATPTSLPTATPTATATVTPIPTHTPLPTATPTNTETPLPTKTPTAIPTQTPLPSATPTIKPTPRPTTTPTRLPTNTPQPTPRPTTTPTRLPTSTPQPTPRPTITPTRLPTDTPQPTATSPRAIARLTSPATATPTASLTRRATATPVDSPTTRPTSLSTPVVVAAALKVNSSDKPAETPPARPALPEASPAGLVDAVPLTNSSIALSWVPQSKTARYRIYSDMGSGYGVYLHKADVSEPAFVDKMLRSGVVYSYRVTRLEANQEVVLAQTNQATFGREKTLVPVVAANAPVAGPTVAPAPTALPADAVILGLISENSFTDDFNTLNLVGEVRNDSNLAVGQTHIAVTFYDAAGAVIGLAEGEAIFKVIPPGEMSPFLITLSRPGGLASYSIRAIARPMAPQQATQLSVVNLKRFEDEAGFFHIKGVVENVGRVVAERIKVVAVIYGRDNKIINLGFTYVSPPNLAPGKQATYEVIFTYYPKYVTQKVLPFEE